MSVEKVIPGLSRWGGPNHRPYIQQVNWRICVKFGMQPRYVSYGQLWRWCSPMFTTYHGSRTSGEINRCLAPSSQVSCRAPWARLLLAWARACKCRWDETSEGRLGGFEWSNTAITGIFKRNKGIERVWISDSWNLNGPGRLVSGEPVKIPELWLG